MAIDLKRITEGRQGREARVLIYGGEGVGKSTFSAGAPDPFFIDVNKGSLEYNVRRVVPETWTETIEWVAAVERGQIKCKTVVIDSVSDLEHLGNAEFFPNTTIDKWEGGYGRGETYALTRWRELLSLLERVWMGGRTIILTAQMTVKTFSDPTGPSYDRLEVACRSKLAGLLKQWVDAVLMAREEIAQQKVDNGKPRAITTGVRWAYTRRTPAYDAKARGTTLFPEKIPLSWEEFAKARAADVSRVVEVQSEVDGMLKEIGDKSLNDTVREYLRAQPSMVVEARNRVAARLEEFRAAKAASTNVTA